MQEKHGYKSFRLSPKIFANSLYKKYFFSIQKN